MTTPPPPPFNTHLLRRKEEKITLAVLIHYTFYFSFAFAVLIGRLVFEKQTRLHICNDLQRSLLIPVYCIWLVAEMSRLYVGMKGVLRDKLPEMSAFFLLSFFPQVWTVIYLGFLQEIIFPFDRVLGAIMLLVILLELVLAWRFLRSIITRQSAKFYRNLRVEAAT